MKFDIDGDDGGGGDRASLVEVEICDTDTVIDLVALALIFRCI